MSALLWRHIGLPAVFLTVALFGGFRFAALDHALRFVPPPLTTLLLASAVALLADSLVNINTKFIIDGCAYF